MTRMSIALCDLVALGFETLQKPHDLAAASKIAHQATVVARLGEQYPTRGQFLRGAEQLVMALEHLVYFRSVDPDQVAAWEAICGAALAITRAQAWKSIAWEQENLT